MRRLSVLLFLALTIACNKEITEPGEQPEEATVIITANNRFVEDVTPIRVGGSVTWQFQGTHTVKFDPKEGAPVDVPESTTGAAHTRTFPTAGSFRYRCELHEEIGFINVVPVS